MSKVFAPSLRTQMVNREMDARDEIQRLTDETIAELREEGNALAERYEEQGDYLTGRWIILGFVSSLGFEQIRRRQAREDARVLLESNGHEVRVRQDDDEEWETSCTCGTPLGSYEDRDEADEEARDHAERYHGTVAAEVTA